jgi:two-component system NtrC family sensor kinase
MKWYSRLALKTKFILFTSFIVIAICLGLFLFIERIFRGYLRSEMQQQAGEIAEAFQEQLANFYDPSRTQLSAERILRESREISRIAIYRRIGNYMQPFVQAQVSDLPNNTHLYRSAITQRNPFRYEFRFGEKEYWEFAYPILVGQEVVGLTAVTLNFSQYKILITALGTGTLVILIVGLIAMLISMNLYIELTIRRPLATIVAAMEKVKRSRFDTRVRPNSMDEIGKLAEDFNTMTLSLGEAQEEIMRQNRILEQRVNEATAELRARNLELFRAQDELRRTNRLATAGQVAAMLAHDLGSPLSSISGHLQLMLEDARATPEEKERLRLILTQVERLSDTIHNFLKNVSWQQPQFQPCDLNALLQHMLQLTSPLLMERGIQPVLQLDSSLPKIDADPNQLQQLFLNLITNALDVMTGGGELHIESSFVDSQSSEARKLGEELGVPYPNGFVQVKFKDTGHGMQPEHLKNLFVPFYSTKEFGRGTGLGLAICKQIVDSHNGSLQVESQIGQGTEFTIFFPVSQAHNVRNEEAQLADRR